MSRSPQQMADMLGGLGRLTELRQRLFFVLIALVIYRIGTFIPVPGVNPQQMLDLMESQRGTIIDVANLFTGGALERFSIFALGVMPYISASIILQLLSASVPYLQQLKKEGSSGRNKITQYTRYLTVALSLVQAGAIATALQAQGVVLTPGFGFVFTATVTLTGGAIFLMWLGEQITERGVGNGISLIIYAGIVAALPSAVVSTLDSAQRGLLSVPAVIAILAIVLAVVFVIVFIERGQRRITVNYAQRQGRVAYQQQATHLPFKVNMSGVIPAIFASALIVFPSTIAQWGRSWGDNLAWLQNVATQLTPGNLPYTIVFAALIGFFAFFYTAMVFNSKETADNLKRSGAFIPGIRPGRQTADHIDWVLTRLTAVGAVYLIAVCLLPDMLRAVWDVPFYFGGTSVLIVVVVMMDFIAQVQAHLVSHHYDGLMKKANLKSYGRSGSVRRR